MPSGTSRKPWSLPGGTGGPTWSRAASPISPWRSDGIRLTAARELAAQALEILEKYGWMSEPIAPMVLATMGAVDVWQGRFDDAQPWLDRAEQALRPNAEPAKALLVRYARGIQRLGQGHLAKAVAEFAEAQRLHSLMVSPDPLAHPGARAPGADARPNG